MCRTAQHSGRWCLSIFLACGCSGCGSSQWVLNGFLDPSQVGRFVSPKRNEIRATLGLLEEPEGIQNAEDPTEEDLRPDYSEQRIGAGDIIEVSIFELVSPGVPEVIRLQVSNSGYETIPAIGTVLVAGFTNRELELELKDRLRAENILEDAEVRVTTLQSTRSRFVALGFIATPGAFTVPRPDYRLLEAVAAIGGVADQVDKIYVTRGAADGEGGIPPALRTPPAPAEPATQPPLPVMMTDVSSGRAGSMTALADGGWRDPLQAPAPATRALKPFWDEEKQDWAWREVVTGPGEGAAPGQEDTVPPETPAPTQPAPTTRPDETMPDVAANSEPSQRIIEIPMKELLEFDPRYNIVIRPNDVIYVPQAELGEYYMMGHVLRPGAYRFTGRPLTVKEAIASAGGFDALAWPSRADLTRRLSQFEEQIIQVDLDAIFAGNAADFYLKPNDMLNVGTHAAATFLAVARNAFRLSYGFGFVYDRNFADEDSFFAQEQIRARRNAERQERGLPPS